MTLYIIAYVIGMCLMVWGLACWAKMNVQSTDDAQTIRDARAAIRKARGES